MATTLKMKKRQSVKKSKPTMSQRSFEKIWKEELNSILDYVFETHPYESINALSIAAGLCHQTVTNLRDRNTYSPQVRSLFKLCLAAGVTFVINRNGKVLCNTKVITQSDIAKAKAA